MTTRLAIAFPASLLAHLAAGMGLSHLAQSTSQTPELPPPPPNLEVELVAPPPPEPIPVQAPPPPPKPQPEPEPEPKPDPIPEPESEPEPTPETTPEPESPQPKPAPEPTPEPKPEPKPTQKPSPPPPTPTPKTTQKPPAKPTQISPATGPTHGPVAVRQSPPRYPSSLERRGIGGIVVVQLTIDARGSVTDASVARSSGHQELDRAALAAVKRWRYRPAQKNGRPTPSTTRVNLVFKPES